MCDINSRSRYIQFLIYFFLLPSTFHFFIVFLTYGVTSHEYFLFFKLCLKVANNNYLKDIVYSPENCSVINENISLKKSFFFIL